MAMERGAGESWFASRLRDKLGAVRDQRRLRYRYRAARPQRRAEAHPGLPQREQGRGEQAEGDADEGGHEGEAEQRFLPAEAGERQVEDKGAGVRVLGDRLAQQRGPARPVACGESEMFGPNRPDTARVGE